MTSRSKTPRKVRLTASEVGFAKKNDIPLADLAKAKLPKRGRPKGSKNKPKPMIFKLLDEQIKTGKKMSAQDKRTKAFKRSQDQAVHNLLDDNLKLMGDNKQLLNMIDNLNHQIIGFRAVISYLENRLGLASSQ
jgi:hypothetical protein